MLEAGCCCVYRTQFEWGEKWGQVGQVVGDEVVDGFLADEPDIVETGEGGVIETMRVMRCGDIVGGYGSRSWNLIG
jgi:hypothetical protein